MGNRDRIEAGDAARPEVGRDHIFAKVELRTSAPDGTAGIDEQGAALRHHEQDGIALAYVNGSYFEQSGSRLRIWGNESQRQRCQPAARPAR